MNASPEAGNGTTRWLMAGAFVTLALVMVYFGISDSQPTEFLLALSVAMMGVPVSLAPGIFGADYRKLERPLSMRERQLRTIFHVGACVFVVVLVFRLAMGIR